jgi:hypothetical protein
MTDDIDLDELRAEARAERAYRQQLMRHPDCRDPDHPTCDLCEEDHDTE